MVKLYCNEKAFQSQQYTADVYVGPVNRKQALLK